MLPYIQLKCQGGSALSADNYKILRALNTKGTVHLAADKDGKKYVLKTLSPDSISMYQRIAELPQNIHSERVFECIEQDDNTVAVCEYIEGRTLREHLESGRIFPLKDIKKLICDLCSAVEHLHKNGIIHRDINPNNIMLDDKLNIKLIDYSIARLYSGKKDNDTTIFGTEGYSAPEQYGFKETRFTADVYSIGMVLKMLLNSCADGSATEEVQLRRIAAKCTSFDPDGRYKSAAAVRSAVKRSGTVLPIIIGCAAFAFAAVFSLGVLMMARDDVESDIVSGTAQTTSVTNTTTTTAASATSTVTTVSTAETATSSAAISSAATTNSTTTAITTTKATTKSTTTAKTTAAPLEMPTFEFPEYLELFTLKGSDLDNPNRIEVTTVQDEDGHFADSFEYEFFDDPAVHGEWVYCSTWSLTGAKTPATAEGIINHEFWGEPTTNALRIYDDGSAEIYLRDSSDVPAQAKWTNGYLVTHTGDGIFAERMFVSVIDDVEFLFLEIKSGDYIFRGEVNFYYIFVRNRNDTAQDKTPEDTTTAETSVIEIPEYLDLSTIKGSDFDNPNKMEVTPTQDENGHFAAVYEYEFFDDPAVHGEWVYCNSWQLNGAKMPATAKGIMDPAFQDWNMVEALRIHDGGSAEIYYRDGGGEAYNTKWTNGYLIRETGDGIFAERLFVSVIDDVEFLFMEFKTLDYTLHGDIYVYYIFVRNESEAAG